MANCEITALQRFINGILPENPIFRQMLGMCPVLAVTNGVKPAMTMAGATAFVLICANIMTSLMRNLLQPHLRILVFTLTIATFVTIADKFLAAYLYTMSKTLGPYVPLIIVNCIIISRAKYAHRNRGWWFRFSTRWACRSVSPSAWACWPACEKSSAAARSSE